MSSDSHPPRPAARPVPTRDSVTTINDDGSRYFLQPADVRGAFTRWRRISGVILIAIYLALPWIPVDGYPAVFLDLAGGRFHFFGYTLAAQDTWLLFFAVTGLGFSLFFITALLGRLWCGWACPQTVFLEHLYRPIERLIEGDAPARRALRAAPMSPGKFARKALKHTLYVIVSLVITHLFLAYYVSLPEVWHMMRSAPGEHWTAFLFVFVAAGILYGNFAWFREQLCIVICPYGRLQSALTDDHTMVIGYDVQRGEPRGKLHKAAGTAALEGAARPRGASIESTLPPSSSAATENFGACVDCSRCVQVCPTGIDIRQGLQLECIGCAACIDACDEIMTKVKRPTGLIRYDSLAGFGGGRTRWIRPRTILYGVLLLIGATVAGFALSTVKPASFIVFRMTGAAYFVDPTDVRNQFLVRLVNKRNAPMVFQVRVSGLPAGVKQTGFTESVTVAPLAEEVGPLVLIADRADYQGPFKFKVEVRATDQSFTLAREVEFKGPDARLLREDAP